MAYEAACLLWPPQTRQSLYLTYAMHEESRLMAQCHVFWGGSSLCPRCDGCCLACLTLEHLPDVDPDKLVELADFYHKAEVFGREAALLVRCASFFFFYSSPLRGAAGRCSHALALPYPQLIAGRLFCEDVMLLKQARACFARAYVAIAGLEGRTLHQEPQGRDSLPTLSSTDLLLSGGPCLPCLSLAKAQVLHGQATCDVNEGRHSDALAALEKLLSTLCSDKNDRWARSSSGLFGRHASGQQRRQWHRVLGDLQAQWKHRDKARSPAAWLPSVTCTGSWLCGKRARPRLSRASMESFSSLDRPSWGRRSKPFGRRMRGSWRWYRLVVALEAKFALLRTYMHLQQADKMLGACFDVLQVRCATVSGTEAAS